MKSFAFLLSFFFLTACSENKPNTSPEQSDNKDQLYSTLFCPFCGHSEKLPLPTETCRIKYTCTSCGKSIVPKEGDCCIFCSYGDHKCPSKQESETQADTIYFQF